MNDDILYSPDIVDFVIRKGSYYERYILNHPGIITTNTVFDVYIICYAKVADYIEMSNYMGSDFINSVPTVLGLSDQQSLEAAGIMQVQQQPYLNLTGRDVLIGFIDTGIDYTQKVFQYEDGTSKIKYIYDQSIPGNSPEGFPIGTEYTNEQINAALASDTPYDIVPHKDNAGHGTFLASVAAGRSTETFVGAAPDSEIIMVKLKKAYPFYLDRFCVPPEQENAFGGASVMFGLKYILEKAVELHRPAVVCLGLSSSYDSHDGFSPLEECLFFMANIPGICICTSIGNESASKHHYSARFSKDNTPENIDIKVGDNAGDIFIVITNLISDKISVSVRSPSGELVGRVQAKASSTTTSKLVLEPAVITVSYYYPLEGSGDQVTIVRILDASPGIWTITAYGDIIIDGSIQAWLPTTGFVAPSVEFSSSDPYGTMTYPSTGQGPIHCGAYNSIRNSLYANSSWGPSRLAPNMPDLVAPGYQVGGFYPTGYGFMDGTSPAAAITAGACALLLQWGIIENHDLGFCTPLIKAYLIRGCNRTETMEYPNYKWGYGALNLIRTFYFMREL
ncbi:MAG TPA: peptidase [Lachnospiraceae bacterium]|nr:peptidase [Lachnospiraceae bacterium]